MLKGYAKEKKTAKRKHFVSVLFDSHFETNCRFQRSKFGITGRLKYLTFVICLVLVYTQPLGKNQARQT
jgi:hypothetical protein